MPEPDNLPASDHVSLADSRRDQIFPKLSPSQLHALEAYGEKRRYAAGDILFRQGDRHIPMFALLSGIIDVSREK